MIYIYISYLYIGYHKRHILNDLYMYIYKWSWPHSVLRHFSSSFPNNIICGSYIIYIYISIFIMRTSILHALYKQALDIAYEYPS